MSASSKSPNLQSENFSLSVLAPKLRRTITFRLCGGQFLFSARKKGTKKRAKGEGGQFTCTQVSAFPLGSPTTAPGLVRRRSLPIPEVMRTAQNILQTYQLSVWNSLPRCRGRCRAQRGGRGQRLRPHRTWCVGWLFILISLATLGSSLSQLR